MMPPFDELRTSLDEGPVEGLRGGPGTSPASLAGRVRICMIVAGGYEGVARGQAMTVLGLLHAQRASLVQSLRERTGEAGRHVLYHQHGGWQIPRQG